MTLRIDTVELIPSSLVIGNTGLGVLGSTVPVNGLVYSRLSFPADNNVEIRVLVNSTTLPSGQFFLNENTSYVITGAPAGTYSVNYTLYKDGLSDGTFSDPVTTGSEASFVSTTEESTSSFFAGPTGIYFFNVSDTSTNNLNAIGANESLVIDTVDLIAGSLTIGDTGHGVLAISIPSTGTHGPGYLYNDISLPADAASEIRGLITSHTFPAGTFFAFEDSGIQIIGAPAGTYQFTYQVYENGIALGAPVVSNVETGLAGIGAFNNTTVINSSIVAGIEGACSFSSTTNDSTSNGSISGLNDSLVIDTTDLIAGSLTIGDVGHGVIGSDIPSTGTNGPGYLYNDLEMPGDANQEIRGYILSHTFPPGTFFAFENSSFIVNGAPPGTYQFTYQVYQNGVPVGSPITSDVLSGAYTGYFDSVTGASLVSGIGEQTPPNIANIASVTGDSTIVGVAQPLSESLFVNTTLNAIISGGANAVPTASFNNVTMSTITSGIADAIASALTNSITSDSVMNGGSEVAPISFFISTTEDTIIAGDSGLGEFAIFSFSSITDNTVVAGAAEQIPPIPGGFSNITENSTMFGLGEQASPTPGLFNNILVDSVIIGSAAQIPPVDCSFNVITGTSIFSGSGAKENDIIGSFSLLTDSSVILGTIELGPIVGSFSTFTDSTVIAGVLEIGPILGAISSVTENSIIFGIGAQATDTSGNFDNTTENSTVVGIGSQAQSPVTSFNLLSEDSSLSSSAISVNSDGQFSIITDNTTTSALASSNITGIFNSVIADSTISGFAGIISVGTTNQSTENVTVDMSALGFINSQGSMNVTTANSIMSGLGGPVDVVPPPKGGVAVHIGGGVCLTANGQLFLVVM